MIMRLKFVHWPDKSEVLRGLGYGAVTALLVMALMTLLYVINRAYFNDPSLQIKNLDGPVLSSPVCPGQELEVHTEITVERPMSIYPYFSVMDAGHNFNYNGTQVSHIARPHPHATSFTQTLTWTVPSNLEPGVYSRVLWFRGTDTRENSIYTWTEFEISRDCDKPS